nr:PREDICTED: UDP-glucose iridoid glucosyltransferase-like isoform X2 [Daucus carota subsp. sativus]
MENQRLGRLVLVIYPLQGHATPVLQLGDVLHSKGFAITIAHTRFNPPNPSNHPHFSFLLLPDNLPYSDTSQTPSVDDFEAINRDCHAPLQELLELKEQRVDCQVVGIIFDSLMYFAATVADHIKIPRLVFMTSNAAFYQAFAAIPRLMAEGFFPFQVPQQYPLRFKDLPVLRENMDMMQKLIDLASNFQKFSAIILNTVDFLEQSSLLQLQQQYQVPVFQVGPLSKLAPAISTSFLKEDSNCIAWLDNQTANSVLYVSKGSLSMSDSKELTETFWGLANSGQSFLWVVRPGSVSGSEWTEVLPKDFKEIIGERGLIVKWAPQKEILAHSAVGGFWSHCGWNSTMESLSEGVPMICSPQFLDQKVTARYLTYVWEVGLELDDVLDRQNIERSIRRLMTGREGNEMRQRAIKLKQMINVSILKGGSSFNSLNDLTEFILTENLPPNKSSSESKLGDNF